MQEQKDKYSYCIADIGNRTYNLNFLIDLYLMLTIWNVFTCLKECTYYTVQYNYKLC